VSALASLLFLFVVAGCSRETPPPATSIRPVKTTVVAPGGELETRTFSGRAQASQEAELAFQVPGLLVRFPVREGQRVAQGDLIAQLRQEEFEARQNSLQSQLEQAQVELGALQAGVRPEERLRLEANVRASEARVANAKAQYDRFADLVKTDAVSRSEFESMQTTYRIAQEELKSARQQLEQGTTGRPEDIEAKRAAIRGLQSRVREATVQLEDSTLNAPFAGVVARRFVEESQNISARQPVVVLQSTDEIDIAVDVPESIMALGLTPDDIVEMAAEFSAARGVRFPVKVKEIAKVADPITQTFRVRVGMTAPPGVNVLPGMTATVTLKYRLGAKLNNRLLVPISAVFRESSGEQVAWLVGADQTVKRRPVKLGEATGGRIEIVDGLQSGDRIAVAGVGFLRDGMKIRDLGDALGGGRP